MTLTEQVQKYKHDNWDGDGAERLSDDISEIVFELEYTYLPDSLPHAHGCPGEDGTFGIQWTSEHGFVYLDICRRDMIIVFAKDRDQTEEKIVMQNQPSLYYVANKVNNLLTEYIFNDQQNNHVITKNVERLVDAILYDLTDRRGFRQEWDQVDDDIKDEIKQTWTGIINNHQRQVTETDQDVLEIGSNFFIEPEDVVTIFKLLANKNEE